MGGMDFFRPEHQQALVLLSTNFRWGRTNLTCKAYEEIRDVFYICGISSCIMIHFISLAGLVLNDVEEDIDGRVRVFRCWPISSQICDLSGPEQESRHL